MLQSRLNFYLNGRGPVRSIYAEYRSGGARLQMSTGLRIDAAVFRSKRLPRDIQAALRRLETEIDIYEGDCRQVGRFPDIAEVRQLLARACGRTVTPPPAGDTLLQFYGRYIEAMETGQVLNHGKRYSKAYIRLAGTIARLLSRYKLASVPVDQVSEQTITELASALTASNLARNTVFTYVAMLSSALNYGRMHSEIKGERLDRRACRVSAERVDYNVYLTTAELDRIAALELDGDQARYRDAFLLGCCIGLRYSDLIRLEPTNRRGDLVNINTRKTATPVWAPLSTRAREIWDRYGGDFRLPEAGRFRPFVKRLGELAAIDQPVLFSRTEGGQRVERWKKKWELIGTHTMRRSFATNAFKAGLQDRSIMKITGHKTYESFQRYVRLSDEEHAQHAAGHAFFQ